MRIFLIITGFFVLHVSGPACTRAWLEVLTPFQIIRQLNGAYTMKQLYLNCMIQNSMKPGIDSTYDFANAISMLENENTYEANKILFGTYMQSGDFTAAANKLSLLSANTPEEQDWISLQSILLQLAMDSLTVFEIDSAQEQFIRGLAAQLPGSLASDNARSILRLVYWEEYQPYIPEFPSARMENNNVKNLFEVSQNQRFHDMKNYPDPFSKVTFIQYFVPADCKNAMIKIFDSKGDLLKEIGLKTKFNLIELQADENWQPGVYFYTIELDGAIKEYEKMIHIK